jgi:phosphoribosylanthranilate isomerase
MMIKVCGMRDEHNIRAVEHLDIDWMGFIFYPLSSRYVGEQLSYLPEKVTRVGVFVNEQPEIVRERTEQNRLQILQLHGEESPAYCLELKRQGYRVIKAFGIETDQPFPTETVLRYEGCCDYFLFDTKTPMHGGSGQKFNWEVLNDYRGTIPFLISGGLTPVDAGPLKAFSHPQLVGIDLNSGFETSPAIKDTTLLQPFIEQLLH